MTTATAFKSATSTYAIATTTSASTAVQIAVTSGALGQPSVPRTDQYYVVNNSSGFLFFLLSDSSSDSVTAPTSGGTICYTLAPNTGRCFSGPPQAWFTAVLSTSTGTAYVCGGEGL